MEVGTKPIWICLGILTRVCMGCFSHEGGVVRAMVAQLNCDACGEASTLCRFTKPTNITDYFQFIRSGWLSTPERGWGRQPVLTKSPDHQENSWWQREVQSEAEKSNCSLGSGPATVTRAGPSPAAPGDEAGLRWSQVTSQGLEQQGSMAGQGHGWGGLGPALLQHSSGETSGDACEGY